MYASVLRPACRTPAASAILGSGSSSTAYNDTMQLKGTFTQCTMSSFIQVTKLAAIGKSI